MEFLFVLFYIILLTARMSPIIRYIGKNKPPAFRSDMPVSKYCPIATGQSVFLHLFRNQNLNTCSKIFCNEVGIYFVNSLFLYFDEQFVQEVFELNGHRILMRQDSNGFVFKFDSIYLNSISEHIYVKLGAR